MLPSLAPILLFTYKRLETLKRTVAALQQNELSTESELFIFSDGAKKIEDEPAVNEVREFIKTISGFKSIKISEAEKNKGLANSIIDGVTKIINQYGKVIVLEDDLLTSPNFLLYMNQALNFYEKNPKVFSIAGYSYNVPMLRKSWQKDYYATYRSSSWGWGSWKDRWNSVDWDMKNYKDFINEPAEIKRFYLLGRDANRLLKKQMEGKIDSWAIRMCFSQFKQHKFTIFPKVSKIQNIGFMPGATHTVKGKRFLTILDDGEQKNFSFDEDVIINDKLLRHIDSLRSILRRIIDRFFT